MQKTHTFSFILSAQIFSIMLILVSMITLTYPMPSEAARTFIFPIIENASYSNDYYAPRSNGIHAATDVIASKGSRLVAMTDGVIKWVATPEPYWGFSFAYEDDRGYEYMYLHVNNDTPGTDNGRGGEMNAYTPDLVPGNRVVAGQLLGYVGDSGNAENTVSHLHLEIEKPNGDPKNPYSLLEDAVRINKPVERPIQDNEFLPFGTALRDIDIEAGNFDLDAEAELVSAVTSNGKAKVNIYDNDETLMDSFTAYSSNYRDGITIGTGDVDNDLIDEILVARNGNSRVRAYEIDGTKIADFVAYPGFEGDTRITAGDIDNDGVDEIITAPSAGEQPLVKIFQLDGTLVDSWLAYSENHMKGLFIAAGDLDEDGVDEIVTSVEKGKPKVRVFEPDGTKTNEFYAYSTSFKGGVRLSVGNVEPATTAPEIVTTVANDGRGRIKMYAADGSYMRRNDFMESWWVGSYDVAAGYDYAWGAAFGNRRGTVRYGLE